MWISSALIAVLLAMHALTLASYLRLPHGLARVSDFPRVQICGGIILAAAALALVTWQAGDPMPWPWLAFSAAALGAQMRFIHAYLPIARPQTRLATNRSADRRVSLLVCNVLQTNRAYSRLATLITDRAPDIIVLMEVDRPWLDGLSAVTSNYPERMERPLDNTYGMAIYSRLPLSDTQDHDLVRPDIPAMFATCTLPGGRQFRLITIHPEPPMPHAPTSERDSEIIIAGRLASEHPLPAILTGDLNDVGWSVTTLRFRRLTGMQDPRIGRGMYNTFHAGIPFLRWPLDHAFHDPAFSLVSIERLPAIGSDHFPMWFEFQLDESKSKAEQNTDPHPEDVDEALSLLEEAPPQDDKAKEIALPDARQSDARPGKAT